MRHLALAIAISSVCGPLLLNTALADRATSHYHKAIALKRQGKYDAAIQELKAALAGRSDYAAAHRSIGILYRKKGDYTRAVTHLKKAAELEPKSADVHYSLGLALYRAGKKTEAMAALSKAAKLEPKDARLLGQLGIMLIRRNPGRAIYYLEKAVRLKPQSGKYLHQLGVAHRKAAAFAGRAHRESDRKKHLHQAEKYLVRASALEDTAGLHFDMGVLYRSLADPRKAIAHYEKAVKRKPTMAPAWWDLALMYRKLERDADAVKAYRKFIALRSGSKSAKIAKDRIEALQK